MTASEQTDLAMPSGLSAVGKKAWKIIHDYLVEHDLTYTGGCCTFYSPKAWKERGESYGINSELIVVYDGGNVRECFNPEAGWTHSEALTKRLEQVGLYFEPCTGWYAAVYRI